MKEGGEIEQVARLVDSIAPLLVGHGPAVQQAVLYYLTVTWALGWQDEEVRREMIDMHYREVHKALKVRATTT
jgi:hypothetical protein